MPAAVARRLFRTARVPGLPLHGNYRAADTTSRVAITVSPTAGLKFAMGPLPHLHPSVGVFIQPRLNLLIAHGVELVDDLVLAPLDERQVHRNA